MKSSVTGGGSASEPTGGFYDRKSATMLAHLGKYLKVGSHFRIVKNHCTSILVRFLPLNSSVTGPWSVKTVMGYPRIIFLKGIGVHTTARASW